MASQNAVKVNSTTEAYWTNRSVLDFAGTGQPIARCYSGLGLLCLRRSNAAGVDRPLTLFNWPSTSESTLFRHKTSLKPAQSRSDRNFVLNTTPTVESIEPDTPLPMKLRTPSSLIVRMQFAIARYITGAKGNNWQLEMLCNIGAAELLMPVGSGLECPTHPEDFTKLLDLRQRYKVSTEALLLRLARLCGLSVFAANVDMRTNRAVINYVISSLPGLRIREGTPLPSNSVVTQCTAIGFTAEGSEKWPAIGSVSVQCVGVPPYPGQIKPRILGIVRPQNERQTETPQIKYVRGKWPKAQKQFTDWFANDANSPRLGKVHFAAVTDELTMASIVAQAGYGDSARPRIRYRALEQGLSEVGQPQKPRCPHRRDLKY
jgi:hypothetical protein